MSLSFRGSAAFGPTLGFSYQILISILLAKLPA
jgi:hypothetical protein